MKLRQNVVTIVREGQEKIASDVQDLPILIKVHCEYIFNANFHISSPQNKRIENKEAMLKNLYQRMAELQLSWPELVTLSAQVARIFSKIKICDYFFFCRVTRHRLLRPADAFESSCSRIKATKRSAWVSWTCETLIY